MAIERVVITIPMVPGPALSPNARTYWAVHAKQARELRECAYLATLLLDGVEREWLFLYGGRTLPPSLAVACHIAWPKGRKRHDDDNAWTMVKPARDGVAQAANINDAVFATGAMTQSNGDGQIIFTIRRHDQPVR